ncbi:polyprenyl glycosylphosphotransferase [Enemella evansiae]|uniref:sugar transferase n=1 Tax=Enemella evansiae TaxID=2016499 RepID=UPI000B96E9DD|nr:sugar transferase [Enemella evansiae]OYO07189.1 polyprenyl glycosylphosphotransferase [Enemella evansiae]
MGECARVVTQELAFACRELQPKSWLFRYRRGLLVGDLVVVISSTFGAQAVRDVLVGSFGASLTEHLIMSSAICIAWMAGLVFFETRSQGTIAGRTVLELRQIIITTLVVFGAFAIWCTISGSRIGRGYLMVALPVGTTLLVATRLSWRAWLRRQRAAGSHQYRVLLAGNPATVAKVADELRRSPEAGYRIVGSWTPDDAVQTGTGPTMTTALDSVVEAAERRSADTVIVTGSDDLTHEQIQRLSWLLDDARLDLAVAPSLTDVAGDRLHMTPVAGLPLIHIETPRLHGRQAILKRAFDIVGSLLLLTLLSVPMLVIALLVKLTSRGPVLYHQERIGFNGTPFKMTKFRTMRQGADAELAALLAARGDETTPLFKLRDDPRITRVGRVLRKYSLDEFPQLFNVLRGEMSLVGPRPQVAAEVALYEDQALRRLIVQPGMTGLWQVSGRSTLSWEDALRLDLFYVRNWSLLADLVILLRTFRAVALPGESAH